MALWIETHCLHLSALLFGEVVPLHILSLLLFYLNITLNLKNLKLKTELKEQEEEDDDHDRFDNKSGCDLQEIW